MEKEIEAIMQGFDFKRVHTVMVALDWRWCKTVSSTLDEESVPTIEEIKEEARDFLTSISKSRGVTSVHRGGLRVSKLSDGSLHLAFIVEGWPRFPGGS